MLDLSDAALKAAKARLGGARRPGSLAGGRRNDLGAGEAIRHLARRAVFHFLTNEEDRAAYIERLMRGLKAGGTRYYRDFCAGWP